MLVDIINFREYEKATKLIAHMQQHRSRFYHVYFISKVWFQVIYVFHTECLLVD